MLSKCTKYLPVLKCNVSIVVIGLIIHLYFFVVVYFLVLFYTAGICFALYCAVAVLLGFFLAARLFLCAQGKQMQISC